MGTPISSPVPGRPASISTFYRRETWIEGRAEDQLRQVSHLPGMIAQAAFPDLHPGRHGPVGAAFLSSRIYPQLIGPDIGCGMALFRTDMKRRKLKLDKVARRMSDLDRDPDPDDLSHALAEHSLDPLATTGLATVGAGNHFSEILAVDEILEPATARAHGLERDDLCILVHTGSRGHGARIFTGITEPWARGLDPDSPAALEYLVLHDQATRWARLNRLLVATRAARALRADLSLICDAPHNYLSRHRDLWLHRKGAAAPDRGLAPLAGSRETPSYLLEASASAPETALSSLSHGAGRRYDRASMHGRIRKTRSALGAMTSNRFGGRILCADKDLLIEEAGLAYKDGAQVLADLVHFGLAAPLARMVPLLTFKTTEMSR